MFLNSDGSLFAKKDKVLRGTSGTANEDSIVSKLRRTGGSSVHYKSPSMNIFSGKTYGVIGV